MRQKCARWLLILVAGPALLLGPFPASRDPVQADDVSLLVATPAEGHSGDVFYVNGRGFEPNRKLYLAVICPRAGDPSAILYHNIAVQYQGPFTDTHGNFRKGPFKMIAPPLHHFRGLGCTIYAPLGANTLGPRFPATYTILPPEGAVHPCWRHICLRAKTFRERTPSGSVTTVKVSPGIRSHVSYPWPGAAVDVTLSYTGAKALRFRTTLNLNGYGQVKVASNTRNEKAVKVSVQVRAHLGPYSGTLPNQIVSLH